MTFTGTFKLSVAQFCLKHVNMEVFLFPSRHTLIKNLSASFSVDVTNYFCKLPPRPNISFPDRIFPLHQAAAGKHAENVWNAFKWLRLYCFKISDMGHWNQTGNILLHPEGCVWIMEMCGWVCWLALLSYVAIDKCCWDKYGNCFSKWGQLLNTNAHHLKAGIHRKAPERNLRCFNENMTVSVRTINVKDYNTV